MIFVLAPDEMRAADASAARGAGQEALMRNAGERIAQRVRSRLPRGGRIVAFAGPGDNGGDAFAAFAALDGSYERTIFSDGAARASPARGAAEARAAQSGVLLRELPQREEDAVGAIAGSALAIDALFGTGSRLPVGDRYAAAIRALDARRLAVLAIDVPSGVDSLSGAVADVAVRATETVTLAALKPGLLLMPARECVGELWCADIGIGDATLAAHAHRYAALDDDAFAALLPHRPLESEKRSSGAPLVVAGSRQFPGAAVLCALGAARGGAGYVTVAAPAAAANALRMHLVEQVVVELDEAAPAEQAIATLCEIAQRNTSIAIGPGLGLDDRTGEIVRGFIARLDLPVVADASALFHLAKHTGELRGKRIVLTPHAGEFARLSGKGTVARDERVSRLREFVSRTGATTLLKGLDTLVDDGTRTFINTTGTNALATAGTGDVLTGMIGTLLAQGLAPFDAACAGAYWHGRAGHAAAAKHPVGVIARDVAAALADALPPATAPDGLRRVY